MESKRGEVGQKGKRGAAAKKPPQKNKKPIQRRSEKRGEGSPVSVEGVKHAGANIFNGKLSGELSGRMGRRGMSKKVGNTLQSPVRLSRSSNCLKIPTVSSGENPEGEGRSMNSHNTGCSLGV